MINVNEISKSLNIPVDKLLKMTLQEIIDRENDKKLDVIAERRMDDELMRKYQTFYKHYSDLAKFFGENMVLDVLAELKPSEVFEEKAIKARESKSYYSSPFIYLKTENRSLPKTSGRGSRSGAYETALCDVYLVPYTYQSLTHERILSKLLKIKFSGIENIHLKIYSLNNITDNVYMECKDHKTTVYIPFNLLAAGDVEGIKTSLLEKHADDKEDEHGMLTIDYIMEDSETNKLFEILRKRG